MINLSVKLFLHIREFAFCALVVSFVRATQVVFD